MSDTDALPAAPRGRRLLARVPLEVVLPLLGAYLLLAALYLWQAWRRETPTIFTDELEWTQLSRSVADTGQPMRRGEPLGFTSLVPFLAAPAWWIKDVATAYDTLKSAQVLIMLAAMFPAYGIARLVVSRPWAMAAAVASVAVPALSYAPILVQEPYAYPAATLSLWLIGRAVARPSWWALVLAAASTVLAALVRSQLAVLALVLFLCLLALAWRTGRMQAWRATWARSDWIGFGVLALGGVLAASAFLGAYSTEWADVSAHWKGRLFDYGAWAAGAFAVGLGFFPVVAALTALVRPREQYRDPGTRAWVTLAAASLAALTWYAAVKGAHLSTIFSSLIVERNLMYLAPVVFAGATLVLERRDPAWWAALLAGALVLWTVWEMPIRLDYPYYESHGIALLAFANRILVWPVETIQHGLVVAVLVATGLVALLAAVRHTRFGRWVAVGVAVACGAWGLTGEIYAANGENRSAERFGANLTDPPTWIDDAVGDGTVVLFGQQLGSDPTGLWEDEFWNRSIVKVWSVDGTAPGPGPTLTPDLAAPDGTLTSPPGTDYALTYNGVELQSPVVSRLGTTTLYRIDGGPLKLAFNQTGVYPDGWMGAEAAYNRFGVEGDGPGFARVTLSREAGCYGDPSRVTVRIGPVVVGDDKQPAIGSVTDERTVEVEPCASQTLLLRPPPGPWRVEVDSTTFVPAELDPTLGDRRELGVRIAFGFEPL